MMSDPDHARPGVGLVEAQLRAAAARFTLSDPAKERLLQRVREAVPRRADRPKWWMASASVLACLGLAFVAVWKVPAVQAQQLVSTADVQVPAAAGLRSLHMVSHDLMRTRSGAPCIEQVELWWNGQQGWRIDDTGTCGPRRVEVSTGQSQGTPSTAAGTLGTSTAVLPTAPIASIVAFSRPQQVARVTGRAVLAGHDTTQVTLTPTYRHLFSAMWPGVYEGKTVLWIDPTTHLVLQAVTYTADGSVWFSSQPTLVTYDAPIDAATLQSTSTPPLAGSQSAIALPSSAPWGPLSWAAARARATFSVLAPQSVPPGMVLVLQGAVTGPIDSITLTGYDSAGRDVLDIMEQPAKGVDMSAMPQAMRDGSQVSIGGFLVHEYAGAHFWWTSAGRWIAVGSDSQVPGSLSSEQVRAIVATLSSTASPALTTSVPAGPSTRWTVWVPARGPAGVPLGQGSLEVGRTLAQFQQTWSWPDSRQARNVTLTEVPAAGLQNGPVPADAEVPGIAQGPATTRSTMTVDGVTAALTVFLPTGAPRVLSQYTLTFVRDRTAVQLTATGVATPVATLLAIASHLRARPAVGADWATSG